MADLIPPHGGLGEPICRTVPANEIESFKAEAARLPKVPVSQADLSTIYRIADGTLSPLTGPMNRKVYDRVLDESVVEHGGKLYAWTIPLSLARDERNRRDARRREKGRSHRPGRADRGDARRQRRL